MSSDIVVEVVLLLFLIGLNAFFAAAEISIISVRKMRLRQMIDEGVPGARLVQDLAENSSRLLATIQIGATLVGFFAAATNAVTFAPALEGLLRASSVAILANHAAALALAATTIVLAAVVLIFGELVPKNLALQHSERIALLVARPLAIIITALRPAVSILSAVADAFVRLMGAPAGTTMPFVTEEDIKTMVDAGEETGVLEESEKAMIYGVFDLGETIVREVMVPRVDIIMIDVHTPLREAAHVAMRSGYSRLPVYDETPDKVVGILHVKDLLAVLITDNPPTDMRSCAPRTTYPRRSWWMLSCMRCRAWASRWLSLLMSTGARPAW